MRNRDRLIESAITKIVKKVVVEQSTKGFLTKRQYSQARKGIEMLVNALFDLENVSVDDPKKTEKRAYAAEIRDHIVDIRKIIDELV